jgi:hypothetical protein
MLAARLSFRIIFSPSVAAGLAGTAAPGGSLVFGLDSPGPCPLLRFSEFGFRPSGFRLWTSDFPLPTRPCFSSLSFIDLYLLLASQALVGFVAFGFPISEDFGLRASDFLGLPHMLFWSKFGEALRTNPAWTIPKGLYPPALGLLATCSRKLSEFIGVARGSRPQGPSYPGKQSAIHRPQHRSGCALWRRKITTVAAQSWCPFMSAFGFRASGFFRPSAFGFRHSVLHGPTISHLFEKYVRYVCYVRYVRSFFVIGHFIGVLGWFFCRFLTFFCSSP